MLVTVCHSTAVVVLRCTAIAQQALLTRSTPYSHAHFLHCMLAVCVCLLAHHTTNITTCVTTLQAAALLQLLQRPLPGSAQLAAAFDVFDHTDGTDLEDLLDTLQRIAKHAGAEADTDDDNNDGDEVQADEQEASHLSDIILKLYLQYTKLSSALQLSLAWHFCVHQCVVVAQLRVFTRTAACTKGDG
jgi:hypothetical protein